MHILYFCEGFCVIRQIEVVSPSRPHCLSVCMHVCMYMDVCMHVLCTSRPLSKTHIHTCRIPQDHCLRLQDQM